MQDLLFLAHRIPYPPDKGDKIRSWNLLQHLAAHYRVHLGCFIDDAADWRHRDIVQKLCGECRFVALKPGRARLRMAAGILGGAPLTLRHYRDADMAAWVTAVLERRRIGRVFVYSSAMAQYVPGAMDPGAVGPGAENLRRVIDFVDVDSDKWRQYAMRKPWPLRHLYARESTALLNFERRIATLFDASLLVSPAEAALFRQLAPAAADKIHDLKNGVDFEYFSPERAYDDPFSGAPGVLVFTGTMDYWANVDAVTWFAQEVMPHLRRRVAHARFCIVGARPTPQVLRLRRLPGVTVTGRVADVRPYLAHAAAVVAPLRIARGIQNKVLEAMAMAKAVLASPEALEGIEAAQGREVLVADGAEAMTEAAASLLTLGRHDTLGRQARAYVRRHHDWAVQLAQVATFLEGTGRPSTARALP